MLKITSIEYLDLLKSFKNFKNLKKIINTLFIIPIALFLLLNNVVQADSIIKTTVETTPSVVSSPFVLNHHVDEKANELHLVWNIQKDYHLYKNEVVIKNGENNIVIKDSDFKSVAYSYSDRFKGNVEVFDHEMVVVKSLKDLIIHHQNNNIAPESLLKITYQGCGKDICFPQKTETIDLKNTEFFQKLIKNKDQTEQNDYFQYFDGIGVLFFFILGIGLTFTPCVLPMLPLLSRIIINNKTENISKKQIFVLSLSYVQGMALTYTLLGLLVASFGLKFSIFFQSNEVLIGISLLFIILSLSNFGLFNITFPNIFGFKDKINQTNQNLIGGSVVKTFIMGVVAGLVASPCVSAPLSGILLYVAQRGDLFTGGLALYLLALGIGFPLILISIFGKGLLPKSGEWMMKVKTLFGFILLLFPCILLSRVFFQNEEYEWLLFGLLGVIFFYWLIISLIELKIKEKQDQNVNKNLNIKFHLILIMALLGFSLSSLPVINSSVYLYHSYFLKNLNKHEDLNKEKLLKTENNSIFEKFTKVNTLTDIKQIIQNKDKMIIIDFYANWCVSCKDVEENLNNNEVKDKILSSLNKNEIILLKVDVSKNTKDNEEILQHFNIIGMPSILFIKNNEILFKKTGVINKNELLINL